MSRPLRTRALRRPSGSVYVVTLVVLLVLTVLGLSVALITQSEMQIGVNERLRETMFYAAGSGIDLATAKALTVNDLRAIRVDQVVPRTLPGLNVRNRIDVSRFLPILTSPCDLCQINEGEAYAKINHQVEATASRIAWMASDDEGPVVSPVMTPLAQERLEMLIAFQPWPLNPDASIYAIGKFNQTTSD